jgi:hypothetical protein
MLQRSMRRATGHWNRSKLEGFNECNQVLQRVPVSIFEEMRVGDPSRDARRLLDIPLLLGVRGYCWLCHWPGRPACSTLTATVSVSAPPP